MDTTTKETLRRSSLIGSTAQYIFDRRLMQMNIFSMFNEFASRYSNFQLGYSFKTNYLRAACETAIDFHCMAEVVSPFELEYARTLTADSNIIYNGVIPDPEGKIEIAASGGIVNVDNLEEYRILSKIACERGIEVKIGLRVTFDIENGVQSRFGIDISGDDFRKLLKEARGDSFVSVAGFHCHIGSSRPVKYWAKKIEIMAKLAKEYGVEYIDLGGGLYGPMPDELATQFTDYPDSFSAYANAVCKVMKKTFPDERVKLILEPGTALVGNTMILVAEVVNIKEVNGRQYVTLNCNSNHAGFLCDCKKVPVVVAPNERNTSVHIDDGYLAGNTCLEFDYLRKNFTGDVAVGDNIIIKNVGAYSISCSRHFIVPGLDVYDADGNLIMGAEGYDDMFRKYE